MFTKYIYNITTQISPTRVLEFYINYHKHCNRNILAETH